jgi:hypothetical protein
MTKEFDELKAQNAKLTERIAKLEEAAKPPEPFVPFSMPRFDPTEGASMHPSTMKEFAASMPDQLMRDLRADALKPDPITSSANRQPQSQVQRGSGWAKPIPVEPPPGVALADRLMDHQDRIDKAELAQRLVQAGLCVEKKE